jgi:hypothetical protein
MCNDGKIYRFIHQLPESRGRVRLDEAKPEQLAHQHFRTLWQESAELLETTA